MSNLTPCKSDCNYMANIAEAAKHSSDYAEHNIDPKNKKDNDLPLENLDINEDDDYSSDSGSSDSYTTVVDENSFDNGFKINDLDYELVSARFAYVNKLYIFANAKVEESSEVCDAAQVFMQKKRDWFTQAFNTRIYKCSDYSYTQNEEWKNENPTESQEELYKMGGICPISCFEAFRSGSKMIWRSIKENKYKGRDSNTGIYVDNAAVLREYLLPQDTPASNNILVFDLSLCVCALSISNIPEGEINDVKQVINKLSWYPSDCGSLFLSFEQSSCFVSGASITSSFIREKNIEEISTFTYFSLRDVCSQIALAFHHKGPNDIFDKKIICATGRDQKEALSKLVTEKHTTDIVNGNVFGFYAKNIRCRYKTYIASDAIVTLIQEVKLGKIAYIHNLDDNDNKLKIRWSHLKSSCLNPVEALLNSMRRSVYIATDFNIAKIPSISIFNALINIGHAMAQISDVYISEQSNLSGLIRMMLIENYRLQSTEDCADNKIDILLVSYKTDPGLISLEMLQKIMKNKKNFYYVTISDDLSAIKIKSGDTVTDKFFLKIIGIDVKKTAAEREIYYGIFLPSEVDMNSLEVALAANINIEHIKRSMCGFKNIIKLPNAIYVKK